MLRWFVIWVSSVVAFYLIGYVGGYIDSWESLIGGTSLADHVLPLIVGAVAASIGWGVAKMMGHYSKNIQRLGFYAIARPSAVVVEVPMYLAAVRAVTAT